MQELADRIIDHYEWHARTWDADRRMAGWKDKPWHERFIAPLPQNSWKFCTPRRAPAALGPAAPAGTCQRLTDEIDYC